MEEIVDGELEKTVAAGGVVLIDFFATWCGPCRAMEPTLLALAENFKGRARLIKVDIDKSPVSVRHYAVQSVPTLVICKDGRCVESIVGTRTQEQLAKKLAALCA
ncbi:MAG: thioredoxin family protein [Puniceicoccales bacterium]|jgi:thioredoxin 1|nr:thioredoxin family protein [Puniceicoccales bacterium]